MASFLAGYLSPALTATSQAVAGAQRGGIEGYFEKQRLEKEELHRLLEERRLTDTENELRFLPDSGSGEFVGVPTHANSAWLRDHLHDREIAARDQSMSIASMVPTPGEHARSIASALPMNPSAGAGAPSKQAADPSNAPSASSSSIASQYFRGVRTGIHIPVKSEPTHVALGPGGTRMLEQRQSDGTWAPALTAEGDTVLTPVPASRFPRVNTAKSPEERERDTHLHVLNEQINQTQKEKTAQTRIAQSAMNPAADSRAIALGRAANDRIRDLSTRLDSLTNQRDLLAGGLRQPSVPTGTPTRQVQKSPPPSASYIAPPGLPPLSRVEVQQAMTDPKYRAYKESLGYKFTAPAGNAPQ